MKRLQVALTILLLIAGAVAFTQWDQHMNRGYNNNNPNQGYNQGMMQGSGNYMHGPSGTMHGSSGAMHGGQYGNNWGCGHNMMANTPGYHHNGHMAMGMHYGLVYSFPQFENELNFTEEQSEELYEIKKSFTDNNAELRTDMEEERQALADLYQSNASTSKVEKQLEAYYNTMRKLNTKAYDTYQKMYGLLSAQQKEKFNESYYSYCFQESNDRSRHNYDDMRQYHRGGPHHY